MSSVNKATIMGRLGNDPETRHTQAGTAVTEISVATSERWKDRDGNPQERTEWHKVVFWDRLAEIAAEYLRKGHLVYVEGKLQTEKWTDREGVDCYTTKIRADELKLMPNGERGERSEGGGQQRTSGGRSEPQRGQGGGGRPSGGGASQAPRREAPPSRADDFADDDIPF